MYNVHLLRSGPVLAGQGQGQVVTGDQTSVHCRNIITRPQPTVMDQTGLDRILRVVGCVLSTPWLGLTDFFLRGWNTDMFKVEYSYQIPGRDRYISHVTCVT